MGRELTSGYFAMEERIYRNEEKRGKRERRGRRERRERRENEVRARE